MHHAKKNENTVLKRNTCFFYPRSQRTQSTVTRAIKTATPCRFSKIISGKKGNAPHTILTIK